MKNEIVVLFFLFFLVKSGFSQTWERTFGEENRIEFSNDVIETYDNGFIIIGDIGISERDGWMIKTDVNGNLLWEKVLTTELKSIQPIAISETSTNEYVIVGHISSGSTRNPVIFKINECGEKEWCTMLYKNDGAYAWDVEVKENGEILVLTHGMGDVFNERIHLYCFDENGNVLWRNRYASKYDHPLLESPMCNQLFAFNDGGYMIVGSGYHPKEDDPNGLKPLRALFIKVDSEGNEEWLLPFGIDSYLLSTGRFVIENSNGYYTGFGAHYTDSINPIIMNFDYYGNQMDYYILENDTLFNNCFDYNVRSYAEQKENGNFNLGIIHNYELTGPSNWGQVILDEDYNVIQSFNQMNSYYPFSMKKTSDNKLIQASKIPEGVDPNESDIYLFKLNEELEYDSIYTQTFEYDYECDHPIESSIITFNDCNIIVGTEEIPTPNEYLKQSKKVKIKITPNPAKEEISLRFENIEKYNEIQLRITSALGQQVYETTLIKGQSELSIPLGNWQKGVYLVQVYSNGKIVGSNRFVKM